MSCSSAPVTATSRSTPPNVAEIAETLPEAHWAAVAELVGYVLDLRRRVRRKLPDGTVHIEG